MADRPFNTDTRLDWIPVLALFGVCFDWLGRMLGPVWHAISPRWSPGPAGDPYAGGYMLAIILLCAGFLLLHPSAIGHLMGRGRYGPARATVMALAGAPVGLVLAGLLIMVCALVERAGVPASHRAFPWVALLSAPLLGGFWSGWRLGRCGFVIGAVATSAWVLRIVWDTGWSTGSILVLLGAAVGGAVGGRLGQERFQKVKARNDAEIRKAMRVPEPTG